MKKIIYILILIIPISIYSQETQYTCNGFFNNIAKLYQEGNYIEIVDKADTLLKSCQYDKEQQFTIYKYYIAALYNLGFDSLAETYVYNFLMLNPFYKFNHSTDPLPLETILMKFYTYPKFSVSYLGGINKVFVDVIAHYQILDSISYNLDYYSNFSVLSYLLFDLNITKNFSAGIEFGLNYSNYNRKLPAYRFLLVEYFEKIRGYHLGIYARYKLPITYKEFMPYIRGGLYADYTTKFYAEVDVRVVNDTLYPEVNMPLRLERYTDLNPIYRNRLRYGLTGAAGILVNMERANLFFETGFTHDFTRLNTKIGRYIPELINGFYYVSDDLRINRLYFAFGFSVNLKYIVKRKF